MLRVTLWDACKIRRPTMFSLNLQKLLFKKVTADTGDSFHEIHSMIP